MERSFTIICPTTYSRKLNVLSATLINHFLLFLNEDVYDVVISDLTLRKFLNIKLPGRV